MNEKAYEIWESLKKRTHIHVQTRWVGLHHWPDADTQSDRHKYLRHPHRHLFHVHAWIEVRHSDRELEYFEVLDFINANLDTWELGASCELMAGSVLKKLLIEYGPDRHMKVEVLEDGENGSVVEWGT